MFRVYHSNDLDVLKDILLTLVEQTPLSDPFQPEKILVQSSGMGQWLQMQIANKFGVSANFDFLMPATFLWQQYIDNLQNVDLYNQFSKDAMAWQLFELLQQQEFDYFQSFLSSSELFNQNKYYQLAKIIAGLFDQYLVYRPDWILAWQQKDEQLILNQISQQYHPEALQFEQIKKDILWQGELWRALVAKVEKLNLGNISQHRANLYYEYLQFCNEQQPKGLPQRLFIFGISALPQTYLESLRALSQYCDVHLFFNNPSKEYWGDIVDPKFWQKKQLNDFYSDKKQNWLPNDFIEHYELTDKQEHLQVGNPLLASWGKLGRDFFYLLSSDENSFDISAYVENQQRDNLPLLAQVQQKILNLKPSLINSLNFQAQDQSISIHSCYSQMREVEQLQEYLLNLFQQDPSLTPKDIVVMVANIEQYTPYIQAVFGQYQGDERYIPFSISDNKLSENDILIASFLNLFNLKENEFSAETILTFLDVPAIREKFNISLSDLEQIRIWVMNSGIRFGLDKKNNKKTNYNSWRAGLERLLLGYAMRSEQGIWQDNIAIDSSFGLQGEIVGHLSDFIEYLARWQANLQQLKSPSDWYQLLIELIDAGFIENEQTQNTLAYLKDSLKKWYQQLSDIQFDQPLVSEIVADALTELLDTNDQRLTFLVGKVSFCTLLPMRSIPFKVVCLLGMNELDYPRQQTSVSFDLMQYQVKKGDRIRRDDDRYLFLEALLAAQQSFYVSYIGRSLVDNQILEPSILVNQLIDYLADNLEPSDEDNAKKKLLALNILHQHTMTRFSPDNFSQANKPSFAKEWMPLLNQQEKNYNDFISENIDENKINLENHIEINQLIQFVQNPIKYFFEKQLGVYLKNENDNIPDSENFTLDSLQRYSINELLIAETGGDFSKSFEQLKIMGTMPRAEFGEVYQQELSENIQTLKEKISPYLSQVTDVNWFEVKLPTKYGNITLAGNIDHLYEQRRIRWRVSSFKDKYKIESWIYYLVQLINDENALSPLFYCKEKDSVSCYQFEPIDIEQAKQHLIHYIEGYLDGKTTLQWVVYDDIEGYLSLLKDKQNINLDKCQEKIDKLANGDQFSNKRPDIYLQRLLAQTNEINFESINQKTEQWFDLMIKSSTKVKDS